MLITFAETEPGERRLFTDAFGKEEVDFVKDVEDCRPETEILSVFIHSRVDRARLEALPRLRCIATRSTGFDHIDLELCRARNIVVCRVPDYGDTTIAEHTFALLLAVARRLHEVAHANQRATFSYEDLRGFELNGKTIGVIGAGRIGRHVIRLAKAFGMEVIAFDPHERPELAQELGFRHVPFEELLATSDIVTLHTSLSPENFHLLDATAFSKCKEGVILINTARGGLVDTTALLEALESGRVGAAGLDVLEDESVMHARESAIITAQIIDRLHAPPAHLEVRQVDPQRIKELQSLSRSARLLEKPNVVFTPHVAFNCHEAVARINGATIENLRAFLSDAPINVVDFT